MTFADSADQAVRYIVQKQFGTRDMLVSKFGDDFVERLGVQGYITHGTAPSGNTYERTWAITKKAKNYQRLFLSKLSEEEKVKGRYIHSL